MCRHRLLLATAFLCATIRSSLANERAPQITTIYRGSEILWKFGEDITLPCQADGSPAPVYSWKKNGVTLRVSLPDYTWVLGSGNLVIKSPTESADGEYNCLASNRLGTSVGMKLKVNRPVIEPFPTVPEPTLLTPVIGESLKIACIPPQNYPNPRGSTYFSYTINVTTLGNIVYDNRVLLDYEGNIYFANVIANDSLLDKGENSVYLCVVNNTFLGAYVLGNDHKLRPRTFQGRPEYRPVHLMWPLTRTTVAIKGQTKTLKCIFGGLPTPTVAWYSDKENSRFVLTTGGYGTEISFDNVDLQDEGEYTCSGSNSPSGPSVSHCISMIVQSPPFWSKKLANLDVDEESDIEVDCSVEGTPRPTVEWMINGIPVNESYFSGRKSLLGNKLRYQNVAVNDSQVIQCMAANEHGSILKNVILKVNAESPSFMETPTDAKVVKRTTVELKCNSRGSPKPVIIWTRGNPPHIVSGPRFIVHPSGTLEIQNTELEDTDHYHCQALNKHGFNDASAELIVRSPTVIRSVPTVRVVEATEEVEIPCNVSTDPAEATNLIVEWRKDGKWIDFLTETHMYIKADHSLHIKSSKVRDTAEYTCNAYSGFDEANSSIFQLKVNDKVCPDELDKEYSIHWSRTKAGTESYAPCPRNNSGTCSRECKSLGIDGNPLWSAPNCNGCFDKEFKELLEKVNKVNLTAFKNQTVIAKIASQLSTVTNKSEGLSPGNLNASVMMIKQLADLRTERTINANAMEIKSIVQAANNVLQPNNSKSWQELEEVNKNIATSILFSLDVYGRSLAALNTSDHSIEVEDSLVLEAWSFEKSNLREIEFPNGSLWDENRGDGISISVEAFKNSMSSESPSALHMWGSYYRTVNDYLPGNEGGTDDVNSRVLSFSIDGLKTNERLNRPVLITLRHNQEKRTSFQRTCAFWNFSGGNWDSVGCSVTSTNLTHTICSCDHLTNFAILMSLEPKEDWLLSLISIIGCSISVAALILTIFVYALTWKQAKSAQATVLLNLCVALIIAYIIFMVGADKVHSKGFSKIGCQAVAVLLHYFFLAAFFIMLAEGVELLLYIIFVFHVRRTRETVMLVISAWVLPLIVLGVSLGSTKLEGYGHEKACWLSSENHLIWAFVGPVLGIIAANFVILIIVLRWRSQKKALLSKNVKKRDEINATIWNLAVTCPVLGLGWLFGFLTLAFDHTVFQYMFVAVNSVQGLLIFIFHALFHNKRVNERISSLFSTYICSRCRNSDQAVITQSTSSSQDQPTKKADKKGGAPRGGMGKQGNVRGHGTQLTSFGDSETMESTQ